MKFFSIVVLTLLLNFQTSFADSSHSLSGSRSTRLMNYSLLVGISKSKAKLKISKKRMRSMIARLSRALPAKVSRKAKLNREANIMISSVENHMQLSNEIALEEQK